MTIDPSSGELEFLLNVDGSGFVNLSEMTAVLDALTNAERVEFRNENAAAIARCASSRILIVAGPGSGKSHLFLSRIAHWLPLHPGERVYVATFVRKLVKDLGGDIDARLSTEDRQRVDVSTLHTLARSVVERAGGSSDWTMRPHVRVIDQFWAPVIWDDVLAFHPDASEEVGALDVHFHRGATDPTNEWLELVDSYRELCQFYNAVGFSYLIALATEAALEQPDLTEHRLWIIDEYQDFNLSEDALIRALTGSSVGLLMAGDDEQALYQQLKASTPEIIIGHYNDPVFAKAMLPFCSRCSFYVCRAAAAFIDRHRRDGAIEKIYLPLAIEPQAPRVRVVATAAPSAAVDYIRQFMEDHSDEYALYLERRAAGDDSDSFLLVLSSSGGITMGKASSEDSDLVSLVQHYSEISHLHSAVYLRVLTYFAAGSHLDDNYAIRKVLYFENLTIEEIHRLIVDAMVQRRSLVTLVSRDHPQIIDRLYEIVQIIEGAGSGDMKAQALADVLGIRPESVRDLPRELEASPIGRGAREQEDEEAIETAGAVDPVALMTMVGSKGLSAHHVIVLGCDNVNMQYVTPLAFFVAITRARESLHLVASMKTGGSSAPHRYLSDLPEDCCDYVSYKKTGRVITNLGNWRGLTNCLKTWERGQAFGRRASTQLRPFG